jgi:hypothetical protein
MRPWHVVGLFCEDIRHESHTQSIIGILPDNLLVPTVPGFIPKLGIYIRINVDSQVTDIGPISAKIIFESGDELKIDGFSAERAKEILAESLSKGAPYSGFLMMAVAAGVRIDRSGRINVVTKVGDDEVLCASLNVQVQAPPTASATACEPPA